MDWVHLILYSYSGRCKYQSTGTGLHYHNSPCHGCALTPDQKILMLCRWHFSQMESIGHEDVYCGEREERQFF